MGERERTTKRGVLEDLEYYENHMLGLDNHFFYPNFFGEKGNDYIENAINTDPTLRMRHDSQGPLIVERGEIGNRESFALLYDIYRRINIISYAQEKEENKTLRIFLPKERYSPVFYSVFSSNPSFDFGYESSLGDIPGGKTKVRKIIEDAQEYLLIRLIAHQNFYSDNEINGIPINRICFSPFTRGEDLGHFWEMDDSLVEFCNGEKPGPAFVRYKYREKEYPPLVHKFTDYDEHGKVPPEERRSDAYFE